MKIVSLLPSGTEILFALGLGNSVIAVTDLCDYPPEARAKRVVCRSKIQVENMTSEEVEAAMRRLQASGESPFELDMAWLWEQAPDVILTQDTCFYCEVDAGTVSNSLLGMRRPPRLVVLQPRTLPQIFDSVCQVGAACGASEAAAALAAQLKARAQTVEDTAARAKRRPRVFSIEGANPLVVGGHWIPDLLRRAGGELEPFAPGCPAARVAWETVTDYAPEKLYIDLCSSNLARNRREAGWLAAQPGWRDLPAVRAGEVYLIDHAYTSRPSPSVVTGLEIMAQLTHPELFSGLIPPGAVAKFDPQLARDCPLVEIGRCFLPYP